MHKHNINLIQRKGDMSIMEKNKKKNINCGGYAKGLHIGSAGKC